MPELVWDKVGDRVYESGLDRGVLYLPDGSAVPWNGLTSIIEKYDKESTPVYFDGMKINELITLGSFAASMNAVTYPDEFNELEGLGEKRHGLFYADQMPQAFGLCYRTQIGDDAEGPEAGYKIHILYNVTAIPSDKTYATTSNGPSLVEFEWEITAIPEEVPGFRPTAHFIIDTRKVDPVLLSDLEEMLYGTTLANATLMPMADLAAKIAAFFRVEIIDNGDGTWAAKTNPDLDDVVEFITYGEDGYFEISFINAWYLNDDEYVMKSTTTSAEVPLIKIHDPGGGIWTAASDYDELIKVGQGGVVTIENANVVYIDAESYQIDDTPYDG